MQIRPKNWRDFQHYKDRNPPWIRLHKNLLDNFEFHSLPVASRALAPMLWLLASDNLDGFIDATVNKLAFRLRMSEQDVASALKPLIDNGFFEICHDCINVLAACLQVAVPETETEALQRTEAKTESRAKRSPADAGLSVDDLVADGVDPIHAKDWFTARKAKGAKKLTRTAWDAVKSEAEKAGISAADAVRHAAENSWQGFRASWIHATPSGRQPIHRQSKHSGFELKNYSEGVSEDGTLL